MSTGAILAIAIPIVVVAMIVMVVAAMRRRDVEGTTLSGEARRADRGRVELHADDAAAPDDEPAPTGREVERAAVLAREEASQELVKADTAPPAPWTPPDPDTVGVTRRQFLNRSIFAFMGLSISTFGAAVVAFLWPPFVTGFGTRINLGNTDELRDQIQTNNNFLYVPEGRMWVTEYPADALPDAQAVYTGPELAGMEAGFVALFQKCPHLGCRVPECIPSQWFECPCHGSRYNRVGERRGGPAPRGMDRFAMEVTSSSDFVVDTGTIIQGPPIGVNTTGQEPEGPSCLGASSH